MKMGVVALILAFLLAWTIPPQAALAAEENATEENMATEEAVSAAEYWLTLVDNGQYEQSWDEASTLFQRHVDKADWANTLLAVRGPLGDVEERTLDSATYATELPGAPDGIYVVIRFKTRYANKNSAVETVTPMLAQDGNWRVSGYYIQ